MTPAEINRAIAKWMGWTHLERSGILIPDPPFRGYPPSGAIVGKKQEIPNYHGDLNACREAWMHLDEQKQWEFADELDRVIERVMPKSDIYRRTAVSVNATAPQRAEALLRTLNLWKE